MYLQSLHQTQRTVKMTISKKVRPLKTSIAKNSIISKSKTKISGSKIVRKNHVHTFKKQRFPNTKNRATNSAVQPIFRVRNKARPTPPPLHPCLPCQNFNIFSN